EVKGVAIEIGTSVGIAIMSNEYLSPDELLARADQALYQAKRTRSGFIVYTTTPHLVPPLIDGDDFQDHDATTRKTANRR
ncbi:MAG: diguanylate cyclase, partial [Afipia sp.]|nr:diguanylate cyclase [Afipia sp.]